MSRRQTSAGFDLLQSDRDCFPQPRPRCNLRMVKSDRHVAKDRRCRKALSCVPFVRAVDGRSRIHGDADVGVDSHYQTYSTRTPTWPVPVVRATFVTTTMSKKPPGSVVRPSADQSSVLRRFGGLLPLWLISFVDSTAEVTAMPLAKNCEPVVGTTAPAVPLACACPS